MKKILCSIALITLVLSASFATAQMTATSKPVIMKAIVPEYIGLSVGSTSSVVFDFGTQKDRIAGGETNLMALAPVAPSWNLTYNLNRRTLTVCAYATNLLSADFKSWAFNELSATFINGTSLQKSPTVNKDGNVYFAKTTGCSTGFGQSVMLDQVKHATSSVNGGYATGKPEGFSMLQMNVNPGNQQFGSTGKVPAPGTYVGVLYIVAQAI